MVMRPNLDGTEISGKGIYYVKICLCMIQERFESKKIDGMFLKKKVEQKYKLLKPNI